MKTNWKKEFNKKFGKDSELLLSRKAQGKRVSDSTGIMHIVCNDMVKMFISETIEQAKQEERERIKKRIKKMKVEDDDIEQFCCYNMEGNIRTQGGYNQAIETFLKELK